MTKNARLHQTKKPKLLTGNTGTVDLPELLARLVEYQQQGQLEAVENLCKTILVNDPNNASVCVIYGNILHGQGLIEQAIRAYRRAIRIDRCDPDTHLKLAMALESTGKFSEAVACYKTCLALAPNDRKIHLGLGSAFLKLGKLNECERQLQIIFSLARNDSNAHELAGELALARGRCDEATKHFQHILYIDPKYPRIQAKLGHAMKQCGAHTQAIESFRLALQQTPDDFEILVELSSVQAELGDIKAAEFSLQHALTIKNDSAMLHISLASIFVLQGRLHDACQEYRKARNLEPASSLAIEGEAECLYRLKSYDSCYQLLENLARAKKLTAEGARTFSRVCKKKGNIDYAVQILEKICKQPALPERQRAIALFALGDAYDSTQNFDTAFRNYEQANKLLGYNAYNPHLAEATAQNLIEAYSPNDWSSLPRSANAKFKPIFIMGMPRSGTSLVEQIVASHADVYGAGELPFVNEIVTTIQCSPDFPSNIANLDADQIDRLANQYYLKAGALIGESKVMTDKMPGNIFCIGLMALLFPNAAFVHCTRHPLDTCLSIYFQQFSGGHSWASSLENIAHYYKQYRRFVRHWTETLGIPMLEVHYESLVSDQETHSRRLLEYCGLEWDEKCLNFHNNPRHIPTASHDQVTQEIYTTSIGRWKNYRKFLKPLIDGLGEYAEPE